MVKSIVLAIGILAALGVTAAGAQDLDLEAPAPLREPRVPVPEPGPGPSVPYDPAFIRPFTIDRETPDSTGRMGLSGWTAPSTHVGLAGVGEREIGGWLSLGFTWTWGGPPLLTPAPPGASPPP